MKKLFIYYSRTGSGDKVANALSKNNIDIRKVETKEPLPDKMFFQMMQGCFKAFIKYKDKLEDYDKDISAYDEIIIGTPIWFDRVSAPINRVLSDLKLKEKKISFVLWSASSEANKATERLNKEYNNPSIIILKEPKKYKEELDKLNAYKK